MTKLTEKEAIAIVGKGVVEKLNRINCEPTNRVYDGMKEETEWGATVSLPKALSNKLGADMLEIIYITDNDATDKIAEETGGDLSGADWSNNYYIIR